MPRVYKRKSNKGNFSSSDMKKALDLITKENKSIREAAKITLLSYHTVRRYYLKIKEANGGDIRLTPNYKWKRIFSDSQEQSLKEYLITCSRMNYGLTTLDCRKLAYEMASTNNIKVSEKWHQEKIAGKEWLEGFRRRNPDITLRTPESCSLTRSTSFNPSNVSLFFEKLEEIYRRSPCFADGTRVYNLDETNTSTVQNPNKVLTERGIRCVCKATSAEKGTLVTTCAIVSATGQYIPPAMVFPRVHFKEHMLAGAPSGTLGLANQSGWMTSNLFFEVMKHFIKHTSSSEINRTLLIYDNHESHLSIEVIDLAKTNGVTILTLPPHCSHKMQPLDVGIFKPFKSAYNAELDAWHLANPGKCFSIYNVAACVGTAYKKAVTPTNIISSFQKTGIYPFDRSIFSDIDFLPSSVTDRDLRDQGHNNKENIRVSQLVANPSSISAENSTEISTSSIPQKPASVTNNEIITTISNFKPPAEFRGYPKADKRKIERSSRKRGRTMIATDTSEKENLILNKKIKQKAIRKKTNKTKTEQIVVKDDEFVSLGRTPEEGDYVLAQVNINTATKSKKFYVGRVIGNVNEKNILQVSFLRKKLKKFVMPDTPHFKDICLADIKMILPQPTYLKSTSRQPSSLKFPIDFAFINIR